MVGGGQLARMTHQAAIALGQSLRVLAATDADGAALVAADVDRSPHRPRRAAAFARAATWSPSTTSTCPASTCETLVAEGVTVRPGADALLHAQDKRVMRERLAALGLPVPRWSARRGPAEVAEFAAAGGGPVVGQGRARRLRRAGRLDARRPTDAGAAARPGRRLIVEERVPLAASSPRSWPARRSGRSRRTRWWRPCSATASASRSSRRRRASPDDARRRRPRSSPSGSPPNSDVVGPARRRAVRDRDRRWSSTSWRCARTTPGTGRSRAPAPPSSSSTCAPCSTTRWATSLTAPAVVMANVLGGESGGMALDERLHHLFAADPGVKVHLYGKQARPGARSAT